MMKLVICDHVVGYLGHVFLQVMARLFIEKGDMTCYLSENNLVKSITMSYGILVLFASLSIPCG